MSPVSRIVAKTLRSPLCSQNVSFVVKKRGGGGGLRRKQIRTQSRMCGKGVGLGLFSSESLKSQSYDFDETAHTVQFQNAEYGFHC